MKLQFLPLLLGAAVACARVPQPAPVTPFRLAATLAAAGRCDSATVAARTALENEPDNVLGPLVIGGCQEQAGRYDEAVATYNDFAARHPNARGVAAVRAKAQLALRAAAEADCAAGAGA
ncbi:MAG TPA: tetratricopeptide repeat protein [Gemmatimonadales bacterium]